MTGAITGLGRLLEPRSVAIAGLSSDQAKHGARVLANLRNLGFTGTVAGVNPGLPEIPGVEMFPTVSEMTAPPDIVVCAAPAASAVDVVRQCQGVGAVIVFAGGFGESGPEGEALQAELAKAGRDSQTRILGPNSGGVIRPSVGLAASFLTCLDRPPGQIRTGPVGLVTQSGGTGSYIHNLAAGRGSGLAVSISTGNESDVALGEALATVTALDEVKVILAVIETVRDGETFLRSVESARRQGKPVVACRIGRHDRGKKLMVSHTGAMAIPERVLSGVLETLGVVMTDTPGEAYDVAEVLARATPPSGSRTAVVTHSGGIAILLADLAEARRVELPVPDHRLVERLQALLDHGTAGNPLDMGAIIGGPSRFAEVVAAFSDSGEYDVVLAVSTPHPPAHTESRVESLVKLSNVPPVIHLWMAGDQAEHGLQELRAAGLPVTEDPRAAIAAISGLVRPVVRSSSADLAEITGPIEDWGLPLAPTVVVSSKTQAIEAAERVGFPVVLKAVAARLAHKTDVGAVSVNLGSADAVATAYENVTRSAASAGFEVSGAQVQPYRPGLEMIVAGLLDETFGPIVSIGLGGVLTELVGDLAVAPAPVDHDAARSLVDRLASREALDGFRGAPAADVDELASHISVVSRAVATRLWAEIEINPLIWDGETWVAVDWVLIRS